MVRAAGCIDDAVADPDVSHPTDNKENGL